MRARPLVVLFVLLLPAAASGQYDPRGPPPSPGGVPPPSRAAARERGPGPTGLTLSARVGYGVPRGDVTDAPDAATLAPYPGLEDLAVRKIPVWIELGYRFSPALWGGLYLELAPVRAENDLCPPAADCDASAVRFGIDLQLHLAPRRALDPWIGVGVGGEVVNLEVGEGFSAGATAVSEYSWAGFEAPLLEAGIDLRTSRRTSLGPYVSWSLAQFTTESVRTPGAADVNRRLRNRAMHGWIEVGVRGTLKL